LPSTVAKTEKNPWLGAAYEQIKTDPAAARARYSELTHAFVDDLKSRCDAMSDDES
jgi:hypothetical protein